MLSDLADSRVRWLANMARQIELVKNLATRDVEVRYKHSILGLYWAIINPLVTAAVFGFVFGVIFHATSKPIPYAVFLISGITFWNLFANGVISATTSVTGNAALLAKVYFPRTVLPTAAVFARAIDMGFSVLVLAIVTAAYHVPVHFSMVLVLPILIIEFMFTLGFGFITAALNVLYRDVAQLVVLLLMVWMYLTPVMYAVNTLPHVMRSMILFDPMGAIIQGLRDAIYLGYVSNPLSLVVAAGWALATLVFGMWIFSKIEPLFAEVM